MFSLEKLIQSGKPDSLSVAAKDRIAELLEVSPEALAAFEQAYEKNILSQDPGDNLFETNSRQAAEETRRIDPDEVTRITADAVEKARRMVDQIVDELLAQTRVYTFEGNLNSGFQVLKALPEPGSEITSKDIMALPEPLRPQLTGNLMKVDMFDSTAEVILENYSIWRDTKNNQDKRKQAYNLFRQGLDILDLDALTYEIIGTNKNSMGHWLPMLVEACRGKDFFKIPATKIAKVPLTLLQLTRCEYKELTRTTFDIVDHWAMRAFNLDKEKDYFIKTGTYSSKFDFRNAKVTGAKEVQELGEYLLFIHFQALQMASSLCNPCIYGVSTTNEWVVREFIQDKENNPCIYKGLPLHTEYRVFIDCDTCEIIGYSPYWEPKTMKKRFAHEKDANSPHQIHDYVIYKAHENVLMSRYNENLERVLAGVKDILPDLNLHGQWSLDIMQNGDEFWLIDMALAEQSAFYDVVPPYLRKPTPENWIPKLPEVTKN